EDLEGEINNRFTVDRHRTIGQDIGFGIRQLVDIALKALSPGVNDTTTAINAIDRLGEVLSQIAARRIPSRVRTAEGKAILIVKAPDFEDYVEYAFDEIRVSGRGNFAVFFRMIDALTTALRAAEDPGRRLVLFRHMQLTREFAMDTLETEYEREKFTAYLNERVSENGAQSEAAAN